MRIGSLSDQERMGIEAAQLDAYDRSLDQLADLGAEIIQFQPAKPFEEMKEAAAVILTAEGYFHHGALMDDPILWLMRMCAHVSKQAVIFLLRNT